MIVSWNWLKEYVLLDMPVDSMVEKLTLAGLNHEGTSDVAGDIAIDLEVTSNRPDCLGHIGVAREIAAVFDRELQLPVTSFVDDGSAIESMTTVEIERSATQWCLQYRARVVEGVRVSGSPDWMQRRLRTAGINPINNVVDITNYVLLECGQPLHAFDLDKLEGRRIVVRNARDKETFTAINNKDYELEPWMPVIADAKRAIALAGVMGGAETEVTESTTTLLLESAEFAPLPIRRTSRALDLSSESSYRFERKIDPTGVAWASDRACRLFADLAGGTVAHGYLHEGASFAPRQPIALRHAQIARVLGIHIPREKTAAIFAKLGLQIAGETDDAVEVVPAQHRRDLVREIDLIEEVGRIYGYEGVPEDRVIPLSVFASKKYDQVVGRIRDSLTASGYYEAVTFSFTDSESVKLIRPWVATDALLVQHSSRKQVNQLRQSLLPSLLSALRLNEARGNEDAALFEISQVYWPAPNQTLPEEPTVIGLVGFRGFREARGHVEAVWRCLRIPAAFVPAQVHGIEAGKAAEYRLDDKRIGVIGCVSQQVREALDIRGEPVVAELLLEPLIAAADLIAAVQPIPTLPGVTRDLAIVLDESVPWADLESAVRASAPGHLETVEFLDLYRGKQVAKGKKSIAFRLVYRAIDRTLTHEEVEVYQQTVLQAITKLGGELR